MKINKKIIGIAAIVMSFISSNVYAANGKITVARAFYELARQNNTQKIEILLDRGYSLESVDERGYNPVCISVVRQDKQSYDTLISYGADKSPRCLQKLPESAYKRFFGSYPIKTTTLVTTGSSDTPYMIGAAILGAGAVATAYALRGNTGGDGGKDDPQPGPSPDPDPDPDPSEKCENGTYNYDTQVCDCKSGYGNYGDNTTCYATIENCENQDKATCIQCKTDYFIKDNKCIPESERTCPNGTYNTVTKKCDCKVGYGNYGDNTACYATVSNCATQYKETCTRCSGTYHLKDNICYAPIKNCEEQDGGVCSKCYSGFGIHGGDGTYCYADIPNCQTQKEETCQECIPGYGTHGDDSQCYKDIPNCMTQIQTACSHCNPGYDTYGNPARDVCYSENPCAAYANTIPVYKSGVTECVCNYNKGYYGEPGNCTQGSEGTYQEGDGNQEEWNNLNEKYCNSHGKYDPVSQLCTCYRGYASATTGCAECATNYLSLNGRCFLDLNCEARGDGYEQYNDQCVCKPDYFAYENSCTEKVQCPLHQYQVMPGPDVEEACQCKPGFDESCTTCQPGYTYDEAYDECIKTEEECEEEWRGSKCNICPGEYVVTTDESGKKHCGTQCAPNRAPIEENPQCTECAEGYRFSSLDNNCVVDECTSGVDGYIINEEGYCTCDTEHGYGMAFDGHCIFKGEDVIGVKDSNVNNSEIEINNDGTIDEFHDIYGMKPSITDENGNMTYFDSVYNGLAKANENEGIIKINNANTGQNEIYGIYSPFRVYNAASLIESDEKSSIASASIEITDSNSMAVIRGIMNDSDSSIYNAFAYNNAEASADDPSNSTATAKIQITKDENSSGQIIGISGSGNVINAFANTTEGIAANTIAKGAIEMENEGKGEVIGILGRTSNHKINNAYAFLDSAISDAVAEGRIKVIGNESVIGISSIGTVVNSETQFNHEFNKVNDFRSSGIIEATTHRNLNAAYGIKIISNDELKANIYNALGYNTEGNIVVKNDSGGNAFGIYHNIQKYSVEEEGEEKKYYNNTYNAFRSSEKYGGENVEASGTVDVEIMGNSNAWHRATGIYATGNVFNAYVNSGSEIKLESLGNILINDNSGSPNIELKGIESNGATIANAYATGQNKNTDSITKGNINVNIIANKQGSGSGIAAGIFSNQITDMTAQIYNAALVDDTSHVEGNINVKASASPFSKMYGIYASRSPNRTGEGQDKIVYNAYYDNKDETISDGSVLGTIKIEASRASTASYAEYYGIYVSEGTAYNAYSSNANADVKGIIDVNIAGGENSGIAAGMYGDSSSLHNNTSNSTIRVTTAKTGTDAYGMLGKNSYLENNGLIDVVSTRATAYGLYTNQGQIVNNTDGVINVSGATGSYGIYATAHNDEGDLANDVKVINLGTINLTGNAQNVGIFAQGSNATVENRGVININGSQNTVVCEGDTCSKDVAVQLSEGAQLINSGTMSSTQSLNFNVADGSVLLAKGGKFVTNDAITGNINVAETAVQNTFDSQVRLENALTANDISNLTVGSQSYLYDTKVVNNNGGSYDVVAEIKDFSTIAANKEEAEYLATNYAQKKNMALFNALKSASTQNEAVIIEAKTSGNSMLPNMIEEELKVQRGLDRTLMRELFDDKGEDIRRIVGGDASVIGRGNHGRVTGYDLTTQSMYMLYDKKLDNHYRLGAGLSITHTDTDYNDDSSRRNMMVQGYVPLSYKTNNGLSLVSMARLGYADGEYSRRGYDKTYKADTKEITYGLLNEVRYTQKLKYLDVTPFVGINAIGWYWDNMNEGTSDLALHIDSENVFSLESALGVYFNKNVAFNQDSQLNMALGLGYYHEFADPYKGFDAHHTGTIKKNRISNKLNSRDRGIISATINYDYKDFSVYGELVQYIEKEHPIEFEGGVKYKF